MERNKEIKIRVSEEEYKRLQEYSFKGSQPMATFIREVALNDRVHPEVEGPANQVESPVTQPGGPSIESELIEYWALLIPMLDEEMFLENIMKIRGIGPNIKNIHKVWKHILDRVSGVTSEPTDQQVSQGKLEHSGWTYVCEVPTEIGTFWQLEKKNSYGNFQYKQLPPEHPDVVFIKENNIGEGQVLP
jgi:hypothetical protein